ncbi:TRAP transporter small permease [Vibrio gallicus]|uniref:TRAP transporter small permease n=1 Tax=Vibrio gallicus TaxID=190897 RepID=UPI0021C2C8CF|nr:TRAP transporter small permease [Vibrio gallicus]
MFTVLSKIKNILDKCILSFCGVALLALVASVSWQVFSRYVLNNPSSWTDEFARYTMIWFGLAGACYLYGKNGHLSITLMIDAVPDKLKNALQVLIHAASVIFIYLAMIKGGLLLVGRTMHQFSPALQIPMAYVYLVLPIAGFIMLTYIAINTAQLFTNKEGN